MTRWDLLVVVVVLAMAALAFPMTHLVGGGDAGVVVVTGPEGRTLIPCDTEGVYHIQGKIGEVVFEVHEGHVRCVSSSCPDEVCVHIGEVRPGRPVICAPNSVTAVMEKESGPHDQARLDALSR